MHLRFVVADTGIGMNEGPSRGRQRLWYKPTHRPRASSAARAWVFTSTKQLVNGLLGGRLESAKPGGPRQPVCADRAVLRVPASRVRPLRHQFGSLGENIDLPLRARCAMR